MIDSPKGEKKNIRVRKASQTSALNQGSAFFCRGQNCQPKSGKDKSRGQSGQGQNGHFRFRKWSFGSLYINIKYLYIVAVLTTQNQF